MSESDDLVPATWDGTPTGDPVTWDGEPMYAPEGFNVGAAFGEIARRLAGSDAAIARVEPTEAGS